MTDGTNPPGSAERMTATRRMSSPPEDVFAVLTDPTAHGGIDGTGSVDDPVDTARLTRAGQRFRMAMHHERRTDYETVNEVVVYEPSTAISWRTGYLDDDGVAHFGGWFWLYELAPAADGSGTDVTLTYDWSAATQKARSLIGFPPFGQDHFDDSLAHLADIVAARSG